MMQKPTEAHLPSLKGKKNWQGMRVGLLGGSFNPAHEGHVHISLEAIKRLNLDSVWWLVSPKNPLKDAKELVPYENRLAGAEALTKGQPNIQVSNLEEQFSTNLTIDTLTALDRLCPNTQFIWLMGADNMVQFDQWVAWQDIVSLLPIAILDRPGYSTKALEGKFAKTYANLKVAVEHAKTLGQASRNGWVFLTNPQHPQSSTNIRNRK